MGALQERVPGGAAAHGLNQGSFASDDHTFCTRTHRKRKIYHRFPTYYRFNSTHTVERVCRAAGFTTVEHRVYDAPDRYAWYLPSPADRLPAYYSSLVYRFDLAGLMGHLSFRAER